MENGKQLYTVTLPNGAKCHVPSGTRVNEIDGLNIEAGKVYAVRFNNKVASLQRPVDRDATIEFVDAASRDGGLIYRRSLTFLMIRAINDLFPDFRVYVNHSLNRGYYSEVYNKLTQDAEAQALSQNDIDRILTRMREIVDADEPIVRSEMTIREATSVFAAEGLEDKVRLLRHRADDVISVYRLGPIVNHFYGQLVPSTGYLKNFDIKLCAPGFVLLFPPYGRPQEMPCYEHQPVIASIYQEYERWSRILGIRNVADLNELISSKSINEYVLISEALMEKKLSRLADQIAEHARRPQIILLSGPSASGKTTTVKRLSIQLRVLGKRPLVIGLDDFFVERDKTPKDEYGEYDFESFKAIDVPALQDCVRRLLQGEEVPLPRYNFLTGKPEPGHHAKLGHGQPLILEGIHALNPGLLPNVPDGMKYKIYIAPLTHLNIDDHNRIPSSDSRLLRRIVRDSHSRGYDAAATLSRWPSVRRGEERNIFPYQGEADYIFNSSLHYEMSALKQYAIPALQKVERSNPLYSEASRLIKFLSYFDEIDTTLVPHHSLLREFIGGSTFTY